MDLAKWGTGLGIGMMGLGAFGKLTGRNVPKEDPMNAYIHEVSGSLIVFGAAITFLSSCSAKREKGQS